MEHKKNTKSFASRWGFILASVGSAVGMANVWGFPNKMGSNGGGAFLLIYLLFVFIFSYVGLPAEFAMGRRAATGTLGAYENAWDTRSKSAGKVGGLLGWLPLAGSLCIAIGYACGAAGLNNHIIEVPKTEGGMLFFWAFIVGGILAAVFQCLYMVIQRITPKVNHLHILITAWMVGCILAPSGISTALANFSGEGFSVMITVGGYNMYNVGLDFALGHIDTALLHLGSFLLAVAGLAIPALFTFFIYNWKFGRTPLREVHKKQALTSLEHLGFEAQLTDTKA